MLHEGRTQEAISDCRKLNQEYPGFPAGWFTASRLGLRLNQAAMALAAIEKALALEPDKNAWLLQRAQCLSKLGRIKDVDAHVQLLSSRELDTAYEYSALGLLLTELGQREKAVACYERAIALEPEDSRHYYNIACLQRTLGDIEAAEANFDKAVELNPADFEAFKVRSELRTQTADNNHVPELEKILDAGIDDPRGEVNTCYALAKELEDLGEPERSFAYLKRGADKRRSYMEYDPQRDLDTIAEIQRTFDAECFSQYGEGSDNSEAIFILGMPRTGTTLVERILSSHSEVYAAGELNNFAAEMMRSMRDLAGDKKMARDELVRLSAKLDYKELGDSYIRSTRPFTGHTSRFIDKLPLNYLYVGLIRLALPNARIVNLVRDPMDTCYAIYKQLFIDAYPFSYDLEELAHYYVAYHGLMEHWHSVIPGAVYPVEYEKIVDDLEVEAKALLKYCDLDFEPQCLTYYENREASTTASTTQVRKPVYKSSVGRWRDYERQLQPVVDILTEAGII
jgi:tetratricopeptide (TPR) repeat protein